MCHDNYNLIGCARYHIKVTSSQQELFFLNCCIANVHKLRLTTSWSTSRPFPSGIAYLAEHPYSFDHRDNVVNFAKLFVILFPVERRSILLTALHCFTFQHPQGWEPVFSLSRLLPACCPPPTPSLTALSPVSCHRSSSCLPLSLPVEQLHTWDLCECPPFIILSLHFIISTLSRQTSSLISISQSQGSLSLSLSPFFIDSKMLGFFLEFSRCIFLKSMILPSHIVHRLIVSLQLVWIFLALST